MGQVLQIIVAGAVMAAFWLASRAAEKKEQGARERARAEAKRVKNQLTGGSSMPPQAQGERRSLEPAPTAEPENTMDSFLRALRGEPPAQPATPSSPASRDLQTMPGMRSPADDALDARRARRAEREGRREQELQAQERVRQDQQAAAAAAAAAVEANKTKPSSWRDRRQVAAASKKSVFADVTHVGAGRLPPILLGRAVTRDELARAIVMAEVLGPPLCRRHRAPGPHGLRLI